MAAGLGVVSVQDRLLLLQQLRQVKLEHHHLRRQRQAKRSRVHSRRDQHNLTQPIRDGVDDQVVVEAGSRPDRRVLSRHARKAPPLHQPEPILAGERLGERILKQPIGTPALQRPTSRGQPSSGRQPLMTH